jgi:hypothetical protein
MALGTLIRLTLGFIGWVQNHPQARQGYRVFKTENTDIVREEVAYN